MFHIETQGKVNFSFIFAGIVKFRLPVLACNTMSVDNCQSASFKDTSGTSERSRLDLGSEGGICSPA